MFQINHTIQNTTLPILLLLCCFAFFQSCIPHEKLLNFQDGTENGPIKSQYIQEVQKIVIMTDDILAVTVSTFDTTMARIFNKRISASADGSFIGQGYLVDADGNIEFPVVGKIYLKGMTREEAKDTVRNKLLDYLRNPIVDVRFLNLHVSIFGEVNRPGIFTFPDERFTLLEAITQAGDLTTFADRANIMVIREKEKVRDFGIVDLTSSRAFESPYFYLQQNDAIYIKPLKERARAIEDPWSKIISGAGVFVAVATLIITFTR
ncbi:MAG TPA: hypothetical protein ENJ95_20480 [Bacteroidetes bacterium]|nr:hypothetical protein [Bacteroidota bacterium]